MLKKTNPDPKDTGTRRIGAELMSIKPNEAYTLLTRIDPGRVRSGRAVGLRDGAILALVAAGFTTIQIVALPASAVSREGRRVVLSFVRYDIPRQVIVTTEIGNRLAAWLTEAKLWGSPEPLFRGCRGPLTPMGIWKIINRYRSLEPSAARKKAA